MASISIDIEVNDKGAAAAIAKLIAALSNQGLVEAAALAGAEEIADHAKGHVAVDSGALRDNIRAEGA